MSQSRENYKGESYPKKSKKKPKDKKFFGFRYGSGKDTHAKKGEDFMNDGWPFETRNKTVIKQKIRDDMDRQILDEEIDNFIVQVMKFESHGRNIV